MATCYCGRQDKILMQAAQRSLAILSLDDQDHPQVCIALALDDYALIGQRHERIRQIERVARDAPPQAAKPR